MLSKLFKSTGMDWRISAYQRYWFYFITCRNCAEIIKHERRGTSLQKFVLRSGRVIHFEDVNQARQILLEIWYKKNYTRYYKGAAPNVVVDIGANIGLFSIFANTLWAGSSIHAYEPEPQNFAFLKTNFSEYNKNVHLQPAALSESNDELTLYLKEHSGWHSLYPGSKNESQTRVRAADLTSLLEEVGGKIGFLKMDCEGCEWHSIFKNPNILKDSVGYIAMEYHELGEHRLDEMINALETAGFECIATPPDAWKTGMLYAENHAYPSR